MAFVLDICIALLEEVYAPWEGQGKASGVWRVRKGFDVAIMAYPPGRRDPPEGG